MSVIGVDKLTAKLSRMEAELANNETTLGNAAEIIRAGCVMECPTNDGELRNSIHTRVDSKGKNKEGVVYTQKKYAQYVEFGTGPQGAANHADISPNVTPSYTAEAWWIPGDKLSESAKANYHWATRTSADGTTFYRSDGQSAQPFMYQGLKKTEKKALQYIRSQVLKSIKKG